MAKLSLELKKYFFEENRSSEVKLIEILSLAGERVFGFLFVILALPSALPIPAPGYSIPFGILMFLLAVQLITGRHEPWLPDKMMNGSMKLKQVQKVIKAGLPWLQRIENLTHPRLSQVCTSNVGRIVIGVAISLMSISMMIPIPGTNTLPAMGIFITGFGLMEDDGAITLAGLVVYVLGGILSISILAGLIWGSSTLIDWLKEQLGR
jgi:hypothetical protein